MKILFVGSADTIDFRNKIGGIQSTIKELVLYLVDKKFTVILFVINYQKSSVENFVIGDDSIPFYLGNKSSLRKKLLLQNFDIINFIQTPFENPFFTLLFFIKIKIFKIITTKIFFTYPPLRKHHFFQKIKYKFLIKKCFTFSNRLNNEIKKINSNVSFLFPPVSEKIFLAEKKRGTNNKLKILFAGRLSSDKGLDLVLNIYSQLDRNKYFCGIHGYFASEKDKNSYSYIFKTLNLDYLNITQHILTTDKEYPPPLNEFDILLLPYQKMAFTLDIPLLLLEGLVSGCVIITSNIGDLSQLEGNICVIDNYYNTSEFIGAIDKLTKSDFESKYNYSMLSINNVGNKYINLIIN